ncbi:MAG: aminotransferase class III-fold pyridoxal phosphate-dependent enzyme [Chloroflexi bacterium]|nr:aminotransferase class III-fold pyridoxal phosphate-dependent enzyme [Chloroflexota bacterium]
MTSSLQTLDIGNHHLISQQRTALAAKLAELTPGDLAYTVFGVGGGVEAIDLAIKVACGHSGKQKIVLSQRRLSRAYGAGAGGRRRQILRAIWRTGARFYAGGIEIEALKTAVTPDTAAVILETIPATLGMPIPPPGYLRQVRDLCAATNTLLIPG